MAPWALCEMRSVATGSQDAMIAALGHLSMAARDESSAAQTMACVLYSSIDVDATFSPLQREMQIKLMDGYSRRLNDAFAPRSEAEARILWHAFREQQAAAPHFVGRASNDRESRLETIVAHTVRYHSREPKIADWAKALGRAWGAALSARISLTNTLNADELEGLRARVAQLLRTRANPMFDAITAVVEMCLTLDKMNIDEFPVDERARRAFEPRNLFARTGVRDFFETEWKTVCETLVSNKKRGRASFKFPVFGLGDSSKKRTKQ